MFRFEFGEQQNLKDAEDKILEKLPGKILEFTEKEQSEEFPVLGEIVSFQGFELYKRALTDIHFEIAQSDDLRGGNELVQAISQQSDLIAGVYEGGCKTWECSLDLVLYLSQLPNEFFGSVIELGSGSALPGIYCQTRGAKTDFQDYNEDVLKLVTVPNVLLNQSNSLEFDENGTFETELKLTTGNSNFYAGDWSLLTDIIKDKYDVILTCETIYSKENHASLLLLMKSILKPNGIILVAAKHNYFGCSGSMPLFKSTCLEFGFKIETVFEHCQGIRREIIKLY
jgi:SAM-dependent methyltransferase